MTTLYKLIAIGATAILFYSFSYPSSSIDHSEEASDSLAADRLKHLTAVKEMIRGKEKLASDSVFKNIIVAKGAPAERLLRMMEGFSTALGVSCGHCHNTARFDSEEKPQKDVARQMFTMNSRINRELLKSIKGLQNVNPIVNCTTCHRGQVKPALELSR